MLAFLIIFLLLAYFLNIWSQASQETEKFKERSIRSFQWALGTGLAIEILGRIFGYELYASYLFPFFALQVTSGILFYLSWQWRKKLPDSSLFRLNKLGLSLAAVYYTILLLTISDDPLVYQDGLGLVGVLILSWLITFLAIIFIRKLFKRAFPARKTVYKDLETKTSSLNRQDQILDHYQAAGLDAQDIEYFRSQMSQARDQIYSISKNFPKTAKLRAIEERQDTIAVCQGYFASLVEYPQRLSLAGNFLYKYLPSLEDLIKKYNEINQHIAKNKQTYQILDKSALVIESLCQKINEDYIQFHKENFDQLEDEIKFAEKNIQDDKNLQADPFEALKDSPKEDDLND